MSSAEQAWWRSNGRAGAAPPTCCCSPPPAVITASSGAPAGVRLQAAAAGSSPARPLSARLWKPYASRHISSKSVLARAVSAIGATRSSTRRQAAGGALYIALGRTRDPRLLRSMLRCARPRQAAAPTPRLILGRAAPARSCGQRPHRKSARHTCPRQAQLRRHFRSPLRLRAVGTPRSFTDSKLARPVSSRRRTAAPAFSTRSSTCAGLQARLLRVLEDGSVRAS